MRNIDLARILAELRSGFRYLVFVKDEKPIRLTSPEDVLKLEDAKILKGATFVKEPR